MTPKQELFVHEYLVDSNATQAAIRAGYSAKTAGKIGFENLQKPEILSALAAARAQRVVRTGITADWVLEQQAALYAQTVAGEPEIARKTLRDIGDGIGLYVERVEHVGLTPDARLERLGSILSVARQRAQGLTS